jgi:hypothetical protein
MSPEDAMNLQILSRSSCVGNGVMFFKNGQKMGQNVKLQVVLPRTTNGRNLKSHSLESREKGLANGRTPAKSVGRMLSGGSNTKTAIIFDPKKM